MSEQRWAGEPWRRSHGSSAAVEAERQFRRVIRYVNDRIVPEVRSEAQVASRDIAAGLRRLADALEPRRSPDSRQTSGAER